MITLKSLLFSTCAVLPVVLALAASTNILSAQVAEKFQKGEMAGDLLVPNEIVPETYDARYSMYFAALEAGCPHRQPTSSERIAAAPMSGELIQNLRKFLHP